MGGVCSLWCRPRGLRAGQATRPWAAHVALSLHARSIRERRHARPHAWPELLVLAPPRHQRVPGAGGAAAAPDHIVTACHHTRLVKPHAHACPKGRRMRPDEAHARSLARARTQRPRDGAHFHVRKVQSDEPVTSISPAPTKTTHCTASEWPASCVSDAPLSS